MKIAAASLQMTSTHVASQQQQTSESLRAWIGDRRPDLAGQTASPSRPVADQVDISDAGRSAGPVDAGSLDTGEGDPRLLLIKTLVEFLIGRPIKLIDAGELQSAGSLAGTTQTPAPAAVAQPQPAGYGVEYDYHESYSETEQATFSATGTVRTSDGRQIDFKVDLAMQRSYTEESNASLRLGDAARKMTDPLVLNFDGTATQLTDTRFSFDLDSDGKAEQIDFVGPGSGFLAFDRNHDGKVNNGGELFGPASGDGFAELAALDADHNGWIDENDPAFKELGVWSKDAAGKDRLQSLAETGVGAVNLAYIKTPFDLKGYANQTSGRIDSSGIFLQEDGKAGTIQHVDLAV